jgi:hypothetical protein
LVEYTYTLITDASSPTEEGDWHIIHASEGAGLLHLTQTGGYSLINKSLSTPTNTDYKFSLRSEGTLVFLNKEFKDCKERESENKIARYPELATFVKVSTFMIITIYWIVIAGKYIGAKNKKSK